MPTGFSHDDFIAMLGDLASLQAAPGVEAVLRAAVEAACRATGSPRGLAGLFDGAAATSEAWFDAASGWTPARLRWEDAQGAPSRACLTGTPLLGNTLAGTAAALGDLSGGLRLRRFACVPLLDDTGAGIGFLEVGDRDEEYEVADVRLLSALGRVVAARLRQVAGEGMRQAVDCETQSDIADRLQRRLLPDAPPELPGLDVAFTYRSASAGVLSGGDFIDYYSRSPSTLAFAIGDVAGKGVEAMAVTFVTKYILRAAVHGGQLSWPTNPGEALQELRTGLLEQPDFGPDSERFVTVLFGTVSARRGLLHLASAGHPTPFIVRESGVERPLLLTEPAIGVELGAALAPYPSETVTVADGDIVLAFTDGVAELRDRRGRFFEDDMADVLAGCRGKSAAGVVAEVLRAAEAFSSRPPADDLALLCLRLSAETA